MNTLAVSFEHIVDLAMFGQKPLLPDDDIRYLVHWKPEVEAWCERNLLRKPVVVAMEMREDASLTHFIVEFYDESEAVYFKLRWL